MTDYSDCGKKTTKIQIFLLIAVPLFAIACIIGMLSNRQAGMIGDIEVKPKMVYKLERNTNE
jgi:hypothetical protein